VHLAINLLPCTGQCIVDTSVSNHASDFSTVQQQQGLTHSVIQLSAMKTEKKPNEPSCCQPNTVVKDETDADPVKIKEEGAGTNDDTTGEDTTECPRDPCLDSSNGEGTMSGENQNTNGNQPLLNSVKQEGDPNNPTDDLPGKH